MSETQTLDRALPHNPEAERAILGSILFNNNAYFRLVGKISPNDFYRTANRAAFAVIAQLASEGREIDLITLKDELDRTGKLELIGGAGYVASLVDGVPDIAHVERYAEIVAREARYRNLITVGNSIARRAAERFDAPDEIAREAMNDIADVGTAAGTESRPLYEYLDAACREYEDRRVAKRPSGLVTGFAELDHHRAIRETLIVVGSPSQHGKTAFAVNLADAIAAHDQPVVFFSRESTEEEISLRYASTVGGVIHNRIQNWQLLADSDFPKIARAQSTAHQRRIYLQRRLRTVEAIYAECQRLKSTVGIRAVIIDYIQLLKLENGPRDREERMAIIAQTLLDLALELRIAVIALSQLNKDRLDRDGGRILQGDLKYAAAIGESARVVLLFQRPYADNKAGDAAQCYVPFQIEKNNDGLTNDYDWHFDAPTQTFREGGCVENKCRRLGIHKEETATPLFAAR